MVSHVALKQKNCTVHSKTIATAYNLARSYKKQRKRWTLLDTTVIKNDHGGDIMSNSASVLLC